MAVLKKYIHACVVRDARAEAGECWRTNMHARAPAIFRISLANVTGPEVRAW